MYQKLLISAGEQEQASEQCSSKTSASLPASGLLSSLPWMMGTGCERGLNPFLPKSHVVFEFITAAESLTEIASELKTAKKGLPCYPPTGRGGIQPGKVTAAHGCHQDRCVRGSFSANLSHSVIYPTLLHTERAVILKMTGNQQTATTTLKPVNYTP